jgi:hypothetical protein
MLNYCQRIEIELAQAKLEIDRLNLLNKSYQI